MGNIMITETCNLSCPYCFADEFVNVDHNEITEANFSKALNFLLSGKRQNRRIGLIGGEPTLHTNFRSLLEEVKMREEVTSVLIFTNGTLINETFDITANSKFNFLLNLNSPEIIGDYNFNTTMQNVEHLVSKLNKGRALTLGLNLYDPNMNCDFFVNAVKKFGLTHVRLSITVPNQSDNGGFSKFSYLKNLVYSLYIQLMYEGVNIRFDCNMLPVCSWTNREYDKLSLFQANFGESRMGFNLNKNSCNPVIDILPDLTAVRCFGLSGISKMPISQFTDIDELNDYYKKALDDKLVNIPSANKCTACEMFVEKKCYGGCLANKGSEC